MKQSIKVKVAMEHRSNTWMIFGFLALIVYLLLFMNTYHLWSLARGIISSNAFAIPFIVLGSMSLMLLGLFREKLFSANRPTIFWLLLFLVLITLALVIPDPKAPLKRIHVAEYLLFTILLRYLLSFRLVATPLSIFTVLIAILFSIHDEMLQGLHPQRSYGITDILVDTLSILGIGGLMHSIKLFDKKTLIENISAKDQKVDDTSIKKITIYLLMTFIAALFLIYFLYIYKSQNIPWWTLVPIIITSTLWKYHFLNLKFPSDIQYGLQAFYWLSVCFIFYPIAINIMTWNFK